MSNVEIGTAYVNILPSMNGTSAAINKELGNLDTKPAGEKMGNSLGKNMSSSLKSAVTTGLKAAAVAATAALAGAVAVGRAALNAYAEYEQLVGGVDTLFKESSGQLQEYAASAYKTAGMSANDYMNTVTQFSASLINSLEGDTAKATEYANMAITDMADNANKMGTSIETIQETYSSLARGNYAMLDNLKLGYAGTKAGLEDLLADAEKYMAAQGKVVDYSVDSYADIVEAIHVVQEEMGIAGATAEEAMTTIEGSVNSAKAAWDNWLVGLADDEADIEALTTQLVDSVATAASNIVPRLGQILSTLGPALMETINQAFDKIKKAFSEDSIGLGDAALSLFGSILSALGKIGGQLLIALGLLLASMVVALVEKGAEILDGAIEWVSEVFSEIGRGFSEGFERIKTTISEWATNAKTTITTKWNEITSWLSSIPGRIVGFFSGIGSRIGGFFANAASTAKDKFNELVNFVKSIPDRIVGFFRGIGSRITSAFGSISFPSPHVSWSTYSIFGKSFSIPKISFYASGGIVTDPTLGMIGEAGYDEAVVPLKSSKLKPFAEAVVAEMGGMGGIDYDKLASVLGEIMERPNVSINLKAEGGMEMARQIAQELFALQQRELRGV